MSRIVPLILAVALFMEQMDSTVIATSLPAIARDIGTSPVALKLALTSYLVSLAIFIPISGWMADRFGAKRIFRIAIAVFMAGSLCCAMAGSLSAFVLARFLQGMGGAMMTPVARLVLVRATPKHELVSAMAWLTVPALVGPLIGPPVGGFITTYFTWHWIFLINIPIGVAGIWLAGRYLPKTEPGLTRPIDPAGFLLSGIAASGLVFGLSVISMPALPPTIGLAAVMAGIACGLLYIRHARRTPAPLLDLKLLTNPTFRIAVLVGSLFRIGNGATPFLLPLMLQIGFGLSPFQSGMITFVGALGAIGMKFGAGRIYRTGGFRTVLVVSGLLSSGFLAVNGLFTPATPYFVILGVLLVGGFVRSLLFTGLNAMAFSEIRSEEAGQATAMTAVAQQVSLALGVALAGMILEASSSLRGEPLSLSDFHLAFFLVAIVAGTAALLFSRLPPDAGQAVSGHRPRGRRRRRGRLPARLSTRSSRFPAP